MRPRPAIVGVAVGAVALVLLAATINEPTPPFSKAAALLAAERSDSAGSFLARNVPTRRTVIPLDRKQWRVTYWHGQDELLDLAIGRDGRVAASEEHPPGEHAPGAASVQRGPLVVLLALLFVAALATRPLVSMRNLDAVVTAALFTSVAVIIDARAVAPRVWVGAAGLAYVALRCAQVAFGAAGDEGSGQPLIRSNRLVAILAVATLAAGLVIVATSTGATDVAFAGLAGGTLLNHGTAPYGHLTPDLVHGDTYPPLTYVLYMPFAALRPVHDSFDSLDGALWLNALALALVAVLLWRSRGGSRWALAWLAFPPVLLAASTGGNDVVAAVFVTAAAVALARSTTSASFLALAGWVKLGPAVALVPVLAHMRRAERLRAAAAVVAVSAAVVVLLLALGSLRDAFDAVRFQFERGSWFSPWQQLGTPGLQRVFQAASVGSIAAAAVAVARAPSLRRVAAAAAMSIALLQLSANYWWSAYLPWLLPFMLVALFPPARLGSPPPAPPAP